jgi:hypothetical protein
MPLLLTTDANPGTASWSDADVAAGIVAFGVVTISNGTTQGTVGPLAGLGGALVLLTVGPTGVGEATDFWYSWSGDTLQANCDVDPTQDVQLTYAVLSAL